MNTELKTLAEEKSRDQWLAYDAAEHIAFYRSVTTAQTEPLEALSEMIRQELQDRDLREPQKTLPKEPF